MALPMTYSRRKRIREQSGQTLPFRSDKFGQKLLTQIYQLIIKMNTLFEYPSELVPQLVDYVRQEIGVLSLGGVRDVNGEFHAWFLTEMSNGSRESFELRLDVIELACICSLERGRKLDAANIYRGDKLDLAWALVSAVNERMMEDGFGFQIKDGQIMEFTSEFAYKEVVVPALGLLSNPIFSGANQEFLDAFEEFKQRKYDDCIADCGNAFESVIKVIAAQKGWTDVEPTAPAAKLIQALYDHELIPTWMGEQMKGLKMMLQGAPTVRNKEASHGTGESIRQVGKHLASYQLHQTAAAILFLIEQAEL